MDETETRDAHATTDAPILYRHRAVMPPAMLALLLVPALVPLIILALVGSGGGPPPPAAALVVLVVSPVVLASLALLLRVLQVSVTTTHVHVKYGLWGPRVPVGDIVRCAAVRYDWKEYGGWGIRRGRDGTTVYNMMGDGGHATEIVRRDGAVERRILVGTKDADALVAAIERARAVAGRAR